MGDSLIERVHQPAFIKTGKGKPSPQPPRPPAPPKVTRIKTPATRKR